MESVLHAVRIWCQDPETQDREITMLTEAHMVRAAVLLKNRSRTITELIATRIQTRTRHSGRFNRTAVAIRNTTDRVHGATAITTIHQLLHGVRLRGVQCRAEHRHEVLQVEDAAGTNINFYQP